MIRAMILLFRFDMLEMARWFVDRGIDITFWIIDRLLEHKGALMRRTEALLLQSKEGEDG